jgi:2-oxo-4-hydroxy-4-carboxy--5-ureidoimidazoline (OHCU) decarboxylase
MKTLTKGEQFVYEWQYRMLGGFKAKLADCISHADRQNQAKMLKAFPEEAQGIINFQSLEGYWDSIQDKVEGIK